jgi:hypothetical protein
MNTKLDTNVNIYLEQEKGVTTNYKIKRADKYHKDNKIQKIK